MRKEKELTALLRGLVDLISDEAGSNPQFAKKLDELLNPLPNRRQTSRTLQFAKDAIELPDIHQEWDMRGEAEFRLWLRDQPIPILRRLIRQHDLDAARRTDKWQESEKLSAHIADQIKARLARGASFVKRSTQPNVEVRSTVGQDEAWIRKSMIQLAKQRHGVTLAISKDKSGFDVCVMLSRDRGRGDEISQLFRGQTSFADGLRIAKELSEENGCDGYYEITDHTQRDGKTTFATYAEWSAVLHEIHHQLTPLKERSGINWSSGQPVTPRDLAQIPPIGPQIMRLMELHADVAERRPVTL